MGRFLYTVEEVDGVTILRSEDGFPARVYAMLLKAGPKEALLDVALAQRIGAAAAFGLTEHLKAFRATNPPAGADILRQIAMAKGEFEGEALEEIAAYLDSYDRGQSADAMLAAATGLDFARNPQATPRDSADLGRCVRLYRSCRVVRSNFPKVGQLSEAWEILVYNWEEKCASIEGAPGITA